MNNQEVKYFRVGEEVALVSKVHPHLNGNYFIEECLYCKEWVTVGTEALSSGWSYQLVGLKGHGGTNWWCQSALRKLHKPAGDFEEMMDSLKQPQEEGVTDV